MALGWFERLYENPQGKVRVGKETSEHTFPLIGGLKQGSPSSPYLFTLMTDIVLSKWRTEVKADTGGATPGIKIGPGTHVDNLYFVDDTLLLCESVEVSTKMVKHFSVQLNTMGLEIDVPEPGKEIDPNGPVGKDERFFYKQPG